MIGRLFAALLLLLITPASAALPAPGLVKVVLKTELGPIVVAVDTKHAPITAGNFLRYVDAHKFDGKTFYRAARSKTRPGVGLVQGGIDSKISDSFFPIKHEPTSLTGIHHGDGVISMARHDVGSAMGDFFICLGPSETLDASPGYPGYAAFGHVVSGIEIVRRILVMPTYPGGLSAETMGQTLVHRVRILSATRMR
ncbi:peptidyl-prolyl cis-trans isomerase A (cyclophilin A) [Sphingomonas vulcanisoli]|uniref:peptidylprolyl isomerase n=1 Tax=Sphingomonas vulcanisoli TaxID=1658060 RepID=A0ABX0TMZ6_9SPHN|nr:peptidylprolyl isomerase [Sphingomonas vulcanisoli]NIJ06898.1 peptidyl-prolyl cis-trans isomerase A (cyclophilin A) [Sphingomonas vulcanisoli]